MRLNRGTDGQLEAPEWGNVHRLGQIPEIILISSHVLFHEGNETLVSLLYLCNIWLGG